VALGDVRAVRGRAKSARTPREVASASGEVARRFAPKLTLA